MERKGWKDSGAGRNGDGILEGIRLGAEPLPALLATVFVILEIKRWCLQKVWRKTRIQG